MSWCSFPVTLVLMAGACLGDSGGPVVPEDTDLVVAINSSGTTVNCAGMSVSSRVEIPSVLSFIKDRLSN